MITNFELEDKCNELGIPLVGIYVKDDLPYEVKEGAYIVNLSDDKDIYGQDNIGTHWTCFIVKHDQACYFDSFGVYPVRNVQEFLVKYKPFSYFTKQIQDIKSISCGYYVLFFLIFIYHYQKSSYSLHEKLNLFGELFNNNNLIDNDKLLKNYLKLYGNI